MRDTDGLLLLLLSFGEWLAGSLDRHLTHISCARRVAAVAAEKRARESEDDSQQPSKRPRQDDGNPSAPDAPSSPRGSQQQQQQQQQHASPCTASQLASLLVSQTDHLSTLSQAAHNDNGLPIRVPFNCSLEQANDISTRLIHRYQQLPDASVSLYEYRDHINTALVVSTSSDRPDVDFPCQISRSPILVEVAAWLCRQGTQ